MSADTLMLQAVTTRGWRMGLSNTLGKELSGWFKTKTWLVQAIIWTLIANAITASVLYQAAGGNVLQEAKEVAAMVFFLFGGMAPAVGVCIAMQDAIIGEKQSGTAAWLLSKPLSRPAFIMSKFIANSLGFLVTAVVLPGAVGYVIFTLGTGGYPVANFIAALALVALGCLFWLTLTLVLGAFSSERGVVIGIPLGLLFGYQMVLHIVPKLVYILPYWFVVPLPEPGKAGAGSSLAMTLLNGQPLPSVAPIVSVLVLSIVFVIVAVWRFGREEF